MINLRRNVLIVLTYIAGFIVSNIGLGIYIAFTPLMSDSEEYFNQVATNFTASFYFVMALLLLILFRKYITEQIKDFIKRYKHILLSVISGIALIYALVFIISIIISLLGITSEADNQQSILDMIASSNTYQLILIILFVTVLAPIVEELVFRKGIYGIVGILTTRFLINDSPTQNKKKVLIIANVVAIVISSLAFGAVHATDVYLFLYGGLGLALGTVYYLSGKNVFSSILVHMVYNTISIVVTLAVGF